MLRRPVRTAILLSAALALPALRSLADDPLPKAETVLDQYVEATGGKAAYEKLKSRASKGRLEIEGANVKGSIVAYQAPPNKMSATVDLGDIGKIVEGSDGKDVWELNPITGDRVVEGEEKADKLLRGAFNEEIRWKELFDKVECTGVEDVDGKPAYKVVLTPKVGKPTTEYYDKASHLQVKTVETAVSPMGEIKVEAFPSDYKKVDGVLIAHKVTQKMLTQTILITMDEIKHNVELPADVFKAPEAIKALLEKKDSK